MEELLASIRKAIHEDIGEVPPGAPVSTSQHTSGTVFKGAMRELRVKVGDEVSAAAVEIQELRDKIKRTRASEMPLREIYAPPPAVPPPSPPRQTGFAETLGSEAERQRYRRLAEEAPPPQTLRPSFAEAELRSHEAMRAEPFRRFSREAETVAPLAPAWRQEPVALPPPAAEPQHYHADPAMLSAEATTAASTAFNKLADSFLSRAIGERSVEDMTRELLRGMLKQWLDDNLPSLVERLVREEIERVARRGR